MQLHPRDVQVLFNAAKVLESQGRLDEAYAFIRYVCMSRSLTLCPSLTHTLSLYPPPPYANPYKPL